MKYSKKIRGMSTALAFAFAFMVFSFSFAPKAYAADASLSMGYGFFGQRWYTSTGKLAGSGAVLNASGTTPITNSNLTNIQWDQRYFGDAYFTFDESTEFSGPVKLYASYYWFGSSYSELIKIGDFLDTSTWNVSYINSYGNTGYVVGGLSSYEVINSSNAVNGEVYALEAEWQGSEVFPVRALKVQRSSLDDGFQYLNGSNTGTKGLSFPSIRVIATAYSEEMEALDKVADEIAAQSDILLAMKGDIVAILQDIYTMTGDMHIAQNLLNSYIAQMLPLLESIDQTTTNIYALLSSQLAALETAIETAASSVEAAIEAQTAAMIAYLEEMFNTGNEVPDETYQQQQDAENILDQMESLEKPDVETIVPDIGDIGNDDISGALSSIFSSNLIVTMMTLSASLAFGAYVLFGKRG